MTDVDSGRVRLRLLVCAATAMVLLAGLAEPARAQQVIPVRCADGFFWSQDCNSVLDDADAAAMGVVNDAIPFRCDNSFFWAPDCNAAIETANGGVRAAACVVGFWQPNALHCVEDLPPNAALCTVDPTYPTCDQDGDGVPNNRDQCPTQHGGGHPSGCPDSDGDGVLDRDDRCPFEPGSAATAGCPDRDGDGVADRDDDCDAQPGPPSNHGCPEPPPDNPANEGPDPPGDYTSEPEEPTFDEPGDDNPTEDSGESYDRVACPAGDQRVVNTRDLAPRHPLDATTGGFPTPEAAGLDYLTSSALLPNVPISDFIAVPGGSRLEAREGGSGAVRAMIGVEGTTTSGYRAVVFVGCTSYLAKYLVPAPHTPVSGPR
jgi:hypothetical protein